MRVKQTRVGARGSAALRAREELIGTRHRGNQTRAAGSHLISTRSSGVVYVWVLRWDQARDAAVPASERTLE